MEFPGRFPYLLNYVESHYDSPWNANNLYLEDHVGVLDFSTDPSARSVTLSGRTSESDFCVRGAVRMGSDHSLSLYL